MSISNIRSFVPLEKLGEGSFASVYKVKRISDQKIYALKKIKLNRLPQKAKQNSLNEIRFLASFDSPYITKYYEAFFDQNLDVLCIVMEYAEGGDLKKMINKYIKQKRVITEIQIWRVLIHLLQGLKILHDNKILHRDIKCENILISDEKFKIGDMNVSKVNKEGFVETQTGTPYYASPQVWKDQPYNQKSDIWSLGCILYEMAVLRPPFMGASMEQLYKSILKGKYQPIPKFYSDELSLVIEKCLKTSPSDRPSTEELLATKTLKIYENMLLQSNRQDQKMNNEMLQTICLPKNIKELNKCLPKSNYEPTMQRKQSVVQQKKEQSQLIGEITSAALTKEDQSNIQELQKLKVESTKQEKKKTQFLQQNRIEGSNLKNLQSNIIHHKSVQRTESKRKIYQLRIIEEKYIQQTDKKVARRILRQIEQQSTKKKSRSRSLPRTQRKSWSQSKQLSSEKVIDSIKLIRKQNKEKISSGIKKQDKNHYWNIISQAKKYLQRGLHKKKRLF